MLCSVRVIEATNVPDIEPFAPYVKFSIQKESSKKQTDPSSENPPKWDSEIKLHFLTKDTANLKIELMNSNTAGLDSKIASAIVSLADCQEKTDIDQWYELQAQEAGTSNNVCKIHLVLNIQETDEKSDISKDGLDDILNEIGSDLEIDIPVLGNEPANEMHTDEVKNDPVVTEKVEVPSEKAAPKGKELISLTIHNVVNVNQFTEMQFAEGAADLRCKMTVSGNDQEFNTNIIKDNLAPSWNQVFKFVTENRENTKISFELFDDEEGEDIEPLAQGAIELKDISETDKSEITLSSLHNDNQKCQLFISFQAQEYTGNEEIPEPQPELQPGPEPEPEPQPDISVEQPKHEEPEPHKEVIPEPEPVPKQEHVSESEPELVENNDNQKHENKVQDENKENGGLVKEENNGVDPTFEAQANDNFFADEEEEEELSSKDSTQENDVPQSPKERQKVYQRNRIKLHQIIKKVHKVSDQKAEEEKNSMIEEAKEKAQIYYKNHVMMSMKQICKDKKIYQTKEIHPLTNNEPRIQDLREKLNNPENMTPGRLRRAIKNLEQEIVDLDIEIGLLKNIIIEHENNQNIY